MEREYNVGTWLTPSDEYIKDIKQTLVEKGLATEETPNEELSESLKNAIESIDPNNIRGNTEVLGVKGKIEVDWEDVDVDNHTLLNFSNLKFDYIFVTKDNKKAYCSYSSSSKPGLWYADFENNTLIKIYSSGYRWEWFYEDSKNNCYISAYSGVAGLFHVQSDVITKVIYAALGWEHFFESSNGDLYVSNEKNSSATNEKGVWYVNGTEATRLHDSGIMWKHFFETSDGGVFVYGQSGILGGNKTGLTLISSANFNDAHIYEDSKKHIYISSSYSSNLGFYRLTTNSIEQLYDLGYSWKNFVEEDNGNLYVSSGSNYGLLCVSTENTTAITTTGVFQFYKTITNVIYAFNIYDYTNAIAILKDGAITQIYNKYYNWSDYYESSNGDLYISGVRTYPLGLLRLRGSEITTLFGYQSIRFYNFLETKKGNIYCASYNTVYKIKDDASTPSLYKFSNLTNKSNIFFIETFKGVIATISEKPDGSDFPLIDENTDQVYLVKGGEQI